MDFRAFLNFTQKHRISIKKYYLPPSSQDDWRKLIHESLWRNNSVLAKEVYSLCPEEFKTSLASYVKVVIFRSFYPPIKPYSKKLLNWIFSEIGVEEEYLSPYSIAEQKREDIIDYLLEHKHYEKFLYDTAYYLSSNGNHELFKKICEKLNLSELQNKYHSKDEHFLRGDNIFLNLFLSSPNENNFDLIVSKIQLDKEQYLRIIKICSRQHSNEEKKYAPPSLLNHLLNHLKNTNNPLYGEMQAESKPDYSHLMFSLFNKTTIQHCKALEDHGILSSHIFDISVANMRTLRDDESILNSLTYLYDNFKIDNIDKSYDDRKKTDDFKNFVYHGFFKSVGFLLEKSPYIYSKKTKEMITNSLLGQRTPSGIEWAKRYLTESDIDNYIDNIKSSEHDDPKSIKVIKELTTWKCENFLFSQNNTSPQKKKLKI